MKLPPSLPALLVPGMLAAIGLPVAAQTSLRVAGESKLSDPTGTSLSETDLFGTSVTTLGDLNGDGVVDLAVGARGDDDGGDSRGAVWILFQDANGGVSGSQKISSSAGGFSGLLDDQSQFGSAVAGVGDVDGDGTVDLAVGAPNDGFFTGSVWILFLNADGTVRTHAEISSNQGGFGNGLGFGDQFGYSLGAAGDFNGDGTPDLVVGATGDDDGGGSNSNLGAVWTLFLAPDGTVASKQKISLTAGGFEGSLGNGRAFGLAVASLGDVDGDGVNDLAVSARGGGVAGTDSFWILLLEPDATVRTETKIASLTGGFEAIVGDGSILGGSLASPGDLDGDGIADIIAGAPNSSGGAFWVVFLDATGNARSQIEITEGRAGFVGPIADSRFGQSVTSMGDLNGDGIVDLAVGASLDNDGNDYAGAVWQLFLRQKHRGFGGDLDNGGSRTVPVRGGTALETETRSRNPRNGTWTHSLRIVPQLR